MEQLRTLVLDIFSNFVSGSDVKTFLFCHLLLHIGPWQLF